MKHSVKFTAAAAALVMGLSACAHPALEVPDPGYETGTQSETQSEPQSGQQSGDSSASPGDVVLTAEQVDRIIADIQAALTESDEEQSSKPLEDRVMDPAFSMRKGQLTRAIKTETELAPLVINKSVYSATVGSEFPRVLLVGSDPVGDNPGEVFFITQEDAKADYKLENWARLIGGTAVRGVGVRDGSAVLAPDQAGYLVTPEEALTTYINHLNSPDNEEYQIFDENKFEERYFEELKALEDAVEVAGTVKATAKSTDTRVLGVALDTGQALVSASFNYTDVFEKTVEGATLVLDGTPAAYLKDPVVEKKATVTYQVNIFMVIPPEDSDALISIVGVERVITSAKQQDE